MSVMAAILDFLVMLYLQNCVMAVLHYRKTLNTCYMFYFWPYFHNINDINSSPLPFILHQCKGVRCPPIFLLSNLIDAGWL